MEYVLVCAFNRGLDKSENPEFYKELLKCVTSSLVTRQMYETAIDFLYLSFCVTYFILLEFCRYLWIINFHHTQNKYYCFLQLYRMTKSLTTKFCVFIKLLPKQIDLIYRYSFWCQNDIKMTLKMSFWMSNSYLKRIFKKNALECWLTL